MIFLVNENKVIIGFQTIPETTKAPHIIIDDPIKIDLLKEVLGFAQLDDKNKLAGDFYQVAMINKCEFEIGKLQKEKLTELKTQSDELQNSLVWEVPQVEKETWLSQEQEAKAWLIDNSQTTPVLDVICIQRQCEKAWLVEKVIEKANAFRLVAAEITGKRQKLEDDLKLICTIDGFDSSDSHLLSVAGVVENLRAFTTEIKLSI